MLCCEAPSTSSTASVFSGEASARTPTADSSRGGLPALLPPAACIRTEDSVFIGKHYASTTSPLSSAGLKQDRLRSAHLWRSGGRRGQRKPEDRRWSNDR